MGLWCPYQRGWENISAVLSKLELTAVSRASVYTNMLAHTHTHTHRTQHINTNEMFFFSCTNFEWHLICATASAKGPLLQLIWLSLCAWVPMCAEYLRLCMHVRKRMCVRVCAEMGCCETEALTPSSLLSHWLTAERLKAGKLLQTVGLNDGRYSDPSVARYNNTIQTSHQQPCHLHL